MKFKIWHITLIIIVIVGSVLAFVIFHTSFTKMGFLKRWNVNYASVTAQKPSEQMTKDKRETFFSKLVEAAKERTQHKVIYDPSYVKIEYPGGDVADNRGVCADVIIRAYRKLGIDLQKEVHEDMGKNFNLYPRIWRLTKPDPNIDHRRVANLMAFFRRKGGVLSITDDPGDYSPGDIVAWHFGGGRTHIGILIEDKVKDKKRFMVVHNVGWGPKIEDVLFKWKIIGHFRYYGNNVFSN